MILIVNIKFNKAPRISVNEKSKVEKLLKLY